MINDNLRNLLNETALEGIGHFFFNWDEECAPRILAPYKYRFCEKQHGTAYPEFSQYLLAREWGVREMLDKTEYNDEDRDFIGAVNEACESILNSIDGDDK